jgi:hypothetical protein
MLETTNIPVYTHLHAGMVWSLKGMVPELAYHNDSLLLPAVADEGRLCPPVIGPSCVGVLVVRWTGVVLCAD